MMLAQPLVQDKLRRVEIGTGNAFPAILTSMGFIRLQLRLQNPDDPSRAEVFEALVDTGALVSVVPAEMLEKIGILARCRQQFTLANGTRV